MQGKELIKLAKSYRRLFNSEEGKYVLDDLKKRCFADVSTFHESDRVHAFQEGNRAVYLTIISMLEMDLQKIQEHNEKEE